MSKKIIRSPSYPNFSLSDALAKARTLHDLYRTSPITREEAARAIGYSGLSGPANQALSSLAAYGLMERAGKGDARVTERAVAILHPNSDEEKREKLAAAAFAPPLFQKLRERHDVGEMATVHVVASYLSREGFNANAVGRAAKAFLGTLRCLEEEGVTESHGTQSLASVNYPPSGTSQKSDGDERLSMNKMPAEQRTVVSQFDFVSCWQLTSRDWQRI